MSNMIVFNDSHEAEGFVEGVDKINDQLRINNFQIGIQYKFVEDFVSPEGEYAYTIVINQEDK